MKILVCSNAFPPNFIGGAELIAFYQAKELVERGHDVRIFAGEVRAFGRRHEAREDVFEGLRVTRISMEPVDFDSDHFNFWHEPIEAEFERVVREFEPDIVHGHNLIGLSLNIPRIAKNHGAKVVITLHDHWGYCYKNTAIKYGITACDDSSRCAECKPSVQGGANRRVPMRLRMDFVRWALSCVDAFVSPSAFLKAAYVRAGFDARRIHVVWNGVDVERLGRVKRRPNPTGRLRLSFIGIFAPHKGVRVLLDALARLPPENRIDLHLVGDGSERADYETRLEACGRADWVRFWGKLPNDRIHEVLAVTDVLVLPSLWPENQPVSITEAMAAGIPSIVSASGGMLELVVDGTTGSTFESGNADALARCIARLAHDPDTVARMGGAAREAIAGFSFASQVARILDIYAVASQEPTTGGFGGAIVTCRGDSFSDASASAISSLSSSDGWAFVLREWIDDATAESALVDLRVDRDDSSTATRHAVARVVPLVAARERRMSFEAGSALYYRDARGLCDALEQLRADDALRIEIAARAVDEACIALVDDGA